jgi:LysR family carnitine catabolism transcriptional activator
MPRRYYKTVRPEHYRTFGAVARLGSFAAAGTALGLDRTTVWQQIETLELDLNVPLFHRREHGLELTDEGRLLLELVSPLVAAFDSIRDEFLARVQGQEQLIRVAGIPDVELRRTALKFRELFPKIRVVIYERASLEAVQMVENGDCEFGNCLYRTDVPGNPVVHFERVGERETMLIAPEDHPLATKKRLTLSDLVDYPLITVPATNPWRKYVDLVFERQELLNRVHVAVESNTFAGHVESVRMGLGIAVGWPGSRHPAAPGLRFRSLKHLFGVAPQYLIWKKGACLLPHLQAFVDLFRRVIRHL